MADHWYYTENGQQRGPVPFEQLRHMAAEGQLRPGDMVIEAGQQQWQPAHQVPGLLPGNRADFSPGARTDGPRPRSSGTPAWVWILIACGVGFFVLCCGGFAAITMIGQRANRNFAMVASSLQMSATARSTFEIENSTTADKLLTEYAENAAFADLKYKDKPLTIEGRIGAVDRDEFGTVIVKFGKPGDQRVWCYIGDDDKGRAGRLKVGQKVTLKGNCVGADPATGIEVRRCEFAD